MARETITRGRSALPEQAETRAGITRLRPTWRGVSVALVAIILLAVAMGTGDSALLLVLVVVALPLVIAPIVVLARARRTAGIEVHMMVTPPLVPVGAPCSLLVQLSHSGGGDLPPLGLDRPSDHWSARAPGARAEDQTGTARRRVGDRRRQPYPLGSNHFRRQHLVVPGVADEATRRVHGWPAAPVGSRSLRLVRSDGRHRQSRETRRPPSGARGPGDAGSSSRIERVDRVRRRTCGCPHR